MKKEENIQNFDLSNLALNELITLYESITGFLQYLEGIKIEDEKGVSNNG